MRFKHYMAEAYLKEGEGWMSVWSMLLGLVFGTSGALCDFH